ncbi:SCO1664 family protein [Amycolatopsis echigonensis]|uniref:Repeat protein (TIGR03843 family) n=1 Tax=Amycolatopsis echigonensis TaxID=2576905 RepID=A0A2N3WU09_9PSEU|nr:MULTISPECIES: SCO1664 family protein [Amycolatopsis]MBB2505749.1 SCO1664 family protein [Amycolatopsis echigonensis]PKV97360.1 putative repeat protein (TIGR03843 family) [Amycolatopsis niigatensis]
MANTAPGPADPAARDFVSRGRIDVEGRLVDASNVTLFCAIELDGVTGRVVYKPVSGERPLWDFPDGTLAGREVATAMISDACGLGMIPPTVLRDGPFGPGMVQLWVETDEEAEVVDVCAPDEVPEGWRTVLHAHDRLGEPAVLVHADHPDLRELAVLDIVVNNTDRKGGHLLAGTDGRVYGVDHGICLHTDPKLRTVLWGWIGEELPEDAVEKLRKLRADLDGRLGAELGEHLTAFEIRALSQRTDYLLAEAVFPEPGDDWRAIPWPLF